MKDDLVALRQLKSLMPQRGFDAQNTFLDAGVWKPGDLKRRHAWNERDLDFDRLEFNTFAIVRINFHGCGLLQTHVPTILKTVGSWRPVCPTFRAVSVEPGTAKPAFAKRMV